MSVELYLCWLPEDSGVVFWPNQSFLPKMQCAQFVNQSINLVAFQGSSEATSSRDLLVSYCQFEATDQLFVCMVVRRKVALCQSRLSNWIVEVITLAYRRAQRPLPGSISCHSIRAVSTPALSEIFRSARLAPPTTSDWINA